MNKWTQKCDLLFFFYIVFLDSRFNQIVRYYIMEQTVLCDSVQVNLQQEGEASCSAEEAPVLLLLMDEWAKLHNWLSE